MPRITLAHWHGTHRPGDEIEVTDDELRALDRDGLVASVAAPAAVPAPSETAVPEPAAPVAAEAPAAEGGSRKRR